MAPTETFASMQSQANTAPSVSIVIPCRNEIDHIANCLSSIFDQCEVPGGFEVIVADGMSDDGTREILKRLSEEDSRLTVVDNPGGIVSSGLNAALRDAQGSIIIRMDAHTSYAPDYIRQCVRVLQETGADNVGGPWVACGKGKVGRAISPRFNLVLVAVARGDTTRTIPARSTRSISAAGIARYSIALDCLMRNWFAIKTTNSISGWCVVVARCGNR